MPKKLSFALLLVCVSLAMIQCQQDATLNSIQVLPADPALTFVGQTQQFQAIGTFVHGGHPSVARDITGQVSWTSSNQGAATIGLGGLATAVAEGTTTIRAQGSGFSGVVIGATTLTVAATAKHDLTSITIIPASQTAQTAGESVQFLAIGSYNTAPLTEDLTNQVSWLSSDTHVATINATGLAVVASTASNCTSSSSCTISISATGKSNSGADITSSTTLTVSISGSGGSLLPALTAYEVGLGRGIVTSSPIGINCSSVTPTSCTANFVAGATVTLTATPAAGSTFGGWSANCTPTTNTSCSVVMNNNEPVGVIFNQAQ